MRNKPWNDLSTACKAGEVDTKDFFLGTAEEFLCIYNTDNLYAIEKEAKGYPNVFIRPKADER